MPTPPPKEDRKWRSWVERYLKQLANDMLRVWINIPQVPDPEASVPWLGKNPASNGYSPVNEGDSTRFFQGFLASDLSAPSDPLGAATTATMHVYMPDPTTDELVYLKTVTIKNRDTTLEGEKGTFCKAERIDGERQLYWLACEPSLVTIDDETGDEITDETGEFLYAE